MPSPCAKFPRNSNPLCDLAQTTPARFSDNLGLFSGISATSPTFREMAHNVLC